MSVCVKNRVTKDIKFDSESDQVLRFKKIDIYSFPLDTQHKK